ncbi:POC1 centriolar protein homolog B [Poeciliopsis prolifica]|uniref:POC1 centriolar protein homolog B n=1 Tax=Poeciliopsis prolifica TaxID=188132 RepID=UPI002412EEC1|nr:POC1 centriolar protein homolog B [Poeciliopsis prolifica]
MGSVMDDPTLERHFRGHKDVVTCADFNPNQSQLATGSVDRTLMIWNLAPKSKAFRFAGHQDTVTGLHFSPSGRLLASSSKDKMVRLWTLSLKGEPSVLKGHTGAVRSVSFSHDGHSLATASDDKSVIVWSVPRRCYIYSLSQHTDSVRCARFSPDGRLIASCGDDCSVRLWDTSTKSCINTFTNCGGSVTFVDFNGSGTCIASSGDDSCLKIWDLRTNKLIQHYQVHSGGINSLSFHPSNNYLISASNDRTVKIMDLLEGRLLYTLHGHKGAVIAVAFSRLGDYFASGGTDRQVLLWRTNFDRKRYQDILLQHSRRSTPDPLPHLSDIHPKVPHAFARLPRSQSMGIQINPVVTNTMSSNPQVVEASRYLHDNKADFVARHDTRSEVWTRGESASRTGSTSGNQTGSGGPRNGKGKAEEEDTAQTRPLNVLPARQSNLDFTLQHIVRQLDVLTQTVSVLEERLALTEDKMKECLQHQSQILKDLKTSGQRSRTASEETDESLFHFT